MSKKALNDLVYNFEPDPNYKVDGAKLRKSIQKSRELTDFAREYIDKMKTKLSED